MKKIILITFLFTTSLFFAQEEFSQDFNKWSIELGAGLHKPGEPAAPGYHTNTPAFGHYSLGIRYMMNNRFGVRLGLGYNRFEDGNGVPGNSLPFKSEYYRASLEGVVNFTSLLKFKSWTNSFGVLAHGGVGYSGLKAKEPIEKDGMDQMLHLIVGVTPQLKLSERFAISADLSYLTHIRQHYTWDGTMKNPNLGVGGNLVNLTLGLTFYLGKHDVHADWAPDAPLSDEVLEDIEARIAKIETDMIDSDQDGVPDYLDREPNTVSGVAVDTKGRAIDLNNNGIPDELEASLNRMYVSKADRESEEGTAYSNAIRHLIDSGYVNVYFQFNNDQPETYSLDAINYLVKYMKENPAANAELIGYADEMGDAAYNQKLSERRAKRVYDILLATGVDPSRLTHSGGGQDKSVDKDSKDARQLVRRVTFKLK
ncbi:OmpA family protein [Aequorivita sp. H23M31]|uniref:OmpA family protein n=1 Tax=Aequorivita ciconiae TaxID=2494375 RepID=A0A410G6X6_9FLAO|nr:OmpA family protein [Aequorivita sp. H23M31]QAA83016.1 OmpA family protein [Aequorivita sp. H23M31]